MPFTPQEITDLPDVISAPRFATYLQAKQGHVDQALELYAWNMEVSAAFMVPLHLCEVAIRNAAGDAIEAVQTAVTKEAEQLQAQQISATRSAYTNLAAGLGLDAAEVAKLADMTQEERVAATAA